MIIEPQGTEVGASEITIGDIQLKTLMKKNYIGIVLDNHLKFDHLIKMICNGAGKR